VNESNTHNRPLISVVFSPKSDDDRQSLQRALSDLAQQDPTIRIETESLDGQTTISGVWHSTGPTSLGGGLWEQYGDQVASLLTGHDVLEGCGGETCSGEDDLHRARVVLSPMWRVSCVNSAVIARERAALHCSFFIFQNSRKLLRKAAQSSVGPNRNEDATAHEGGLTLARIC
jgi:hypothetical protein